MTKPLVTAVGGLASASTNAAALAQTVAAAGALALNGASGTATANSIATSQSGTAGTSLTLTAAAAALGKAQYIYITSAGDDSTNSFTVRGILANGVPFSELVPGTNTSASATKNQFTSVSAVIPTNNTASTVTVGQFGLVTLDKARRVLFTSSGTDTGVTFTITGGSNDGNVISETVTGGANASPASTKLDYLTIKQILVSGATAGTVAIGTSAIASSPWVLLDYWALPTVSGQCVVSGTANYTVQVTNDDPNSPSNPVLPQNMVWDSDAAAVIGSTVSTMFALSWAPIWARVLLNSGTGSITMTLVQHGVVPY